MTDQQVPTDEKPTGRCLWCNGHADRPEDDVCSRASCKAQEAASFGVKECPVCRGDYEDCTNGCDAGYVRLEEE